MITSTHLSFKLFTFVEWMRRNILRQCDARIEGSLLGAPTPNPTDPPVPVPVDQPGPAPPSETEPPQSTQEEAVEGDDPPALDGPQDPDKNFCGPTFNDAAAVCSRETNCRVSLLLMQPSFHMMCSFFSLF